APPALVERTLRALHWTQCDLFLDKAALKGNWPTPDMKRLTLLAKRLNVSAIFIGTMRDPADIKDGFRLHPELASANLVKLSLKHYRAHVLSPRVQAFLVTRDGKTAWQDEQMADHPRTRPNTLRTLRVDWQEATEQVAQQLADSLRRLPPPKKD